MQSKNFASINLGIHSFQMTQLSQYVSKGTRYKYFTGEPISFSGDDTFLFYILKGSFRISVPQNDGTEYDLAYCQTGGALQVNKYIIEDAAWDPPIAVAMENSIVIRFNRSQFYSFIQNDPTLFDEYVNNASCYSSLLKQRLLITANVSSSQRLLLWLEHLSNAEVKDGNSCTIECTLTQQQIANLLFIHVSTCNKIFSRLKKEHIAAHFRGRIIIYDLEKLKYYRAQELKIL